MNETYSPPVVRIHRRHGALVELAPVPCAEDAEGRGAADHLLGRPRAALIVRVAEVDRRTGRAELRPGDVEPVDADDCRVARDRSPRLGLEALRRDTCGPRPGRQPLLVVEGNVAVRDVVDILVVDNGAVAGLARIAEGAARRDVVRRRGAVDRHARARPGEAPVRRALNEDAVRVVVAIERDLCVVGDAGTVVRDHRVAAARQEAVGVERRHRRRRERNDPVVPAAAVVGRRVEPRGARAQPVVVGAGDDVLRRRRVDRDRSLVLREAGVVLIQPAVAAAARFLLDLVDRSAVERLRIPVDLARLRALRQRRPERHVAILDRPRRRQRRTGASGHERRRIRRCERAEGGERHDRGAQYEKPVSWPHLSPFSWRLPRRRGQDYTTSDERGSSRGLSRSAAAIRACCRRASRSASASRYASLKAVRGDGRDHVGAPPGNDERSERAREAGLRCRDDHSFVPKVSIAWLDCPLARDLVELVLGSSRRT